MPSQQHPHSPPLRNLTPSLSLRERSGRPRSVFPFVFCEKGSCPREFIAHLLSRGRIHSTLRPSLLPSRLPPFDFYRLPSCFDPISDKHVDHRPPDATSERLRALDFLFASCPRIKIRTSSYSLFFSCVAFDVKCAISEFLCVTLYRN